MDTPLQYFGRPPDTKIPQESRNEFVAVASQTVFTCSYTPGAVDVFKNGALLPTNTYTATNGISITLATGATVGDNIIIITRTLVSSVGSYSKSEANTTFITKSSFGLAAKRGYIFYMGNK